MKIVYYLIFYIGYLQFLIFGKNNKYSYISFRKLHGITNGRLNTNLSKKISNKSQKIIFPSVTSGFVGELDNIKLGQIIDKLNEDGYYVFENKLSEDLCYKLQNFALETPATTVPENKDYPYSKFDPKNPKAPLYKFKEEDLLKNEDLRNILLDTNFLRIAQGYLQSMPLNDIFLMWWSPVLDKKASSKAAQLYHFDMDHPKFIKFFIYLTDVPNSQFGPHCFIKGSHKDKPQEFRGDNRFSDDEINNYYSSEYIKEFTGLKGTILAVDTSGIHKGKVPESSERLILQLEYTNSFFGQNVNHFSGLSFFNDRQVEKLKNHELSYKRFL